MDYSMLVSLFLLSFLMFMLVVLMYIKTAVKKEINRVKLGLMVRFVMAYARDIYKLDDRQPEDRVHRVMRVMNNFSKDWNVNINYNKWKVESRIRKLL
jgi:hypothetical protein